MHKDWQFCCLKQTERIVRNDNKMHMHLTKMAYSSNPQLFACYCDILLLFADLQITQILLESTKQTAAIDLKEIKNPNKVATKRRSRRKSKNNNILRIDAAESDLDNHPDDIALHTLFYARKYDICFYWLVLVSMCLCFALPWFVIYPQRPEKIEHIHTYTDRSTKAIRLKKVATTRWTR